MSETPQPQINWSGAVKWLIGICSFLALLLLILFYTFSRGGADWQQAFYELLIDAIPSAAVVLVSLIIGYVILETKGISDNQLLLFQLEQRIDTQQVKIVSTLNKQFSEVEKKIDRLNQYNTSPDGREVDRTYQMFVRRNFIDWSPYNANVSHRFWCCGTSLIGVSKKGLISQYWNSGVRDIKILLPNTDNIYCSHDQLDKYDLYQYTIDHFDSIIDLVGSQRELAEAAYNQFRITFLRRTTVPEGRIQDYLRKYSGIMHSNITIFDEDAFIAFYDSTGLGNDTFALHFNAHKHEEGFEQVKNEFERMWNAESALGIKRNSLKMGASVIFVNNRNCVLLVLRDNKQDIPFPDRWDVLGGRVETEKGETARKCIIREMQEEIGVQIKEPVLFDVYDMDDRIECTFWQEVNFNINELVLEEGQRLKWFTKNEISGMSEQEIAFGFKPILLDFLSFRNV